MKTSFKNKDVFFLAIVAAFCGGSVPVAAKIALEVFHPFTLVFIRFASATLVLLFFILKRKEFNVSSIKKFIPIGIVGSLNPILLFIALPHTQAAVSPLIYASVPAMIAIYLYFTRNEKLSSKKIVGIVVGLIGVALIVVLPLIKAQIDLSALKGNILIFAAAIAFMSYGIMSKDKQTKLGTSPLVLTFYFCLVTLIISIPFAITEIHMGFISTVRASHIFAGVYTGIVGTGIFYLVYQYALKVSSELTASLFTYLQPIATIFLAAIFLNDKITVPFIIGGVLAVAGSRLAARK